MTSARPAVKDRPSRPKRVALVAAHFTPSNLTSVHRSRLWAQHLERFGWEPVIVTTHWDYYEEPPDWDLHRLVPESLRVLRTRALPLPPFRLAGDLGLRSLWFHYRQLRKLIADEEIDFVHITIPSFFSSLLGRLVHRLGVPYGIDYIDPWVLETQVPHRPLSKAWVADKLADWLEPWAVRKASLITGVAASYYEGVFRRNPRLRQRAVAAAMQYGGSAADHEYLKAAPRRPFLFDPGDGAWHVLYAGAMLPQAYPVLESFLNAVSLLVKRSSAHAARLRLHFVGTGKSPVDPAGFNIKPLIDAHGLSAWAEERPRRIPYIDVLNHLNLASAVLIVGSTERHYTPSKVFQSVLSRRPVFAILHRESEAARLLEESRAGRVVTFQDDRLPEPVELADRLGEFLEAGDDAIGPVRWETFEPYSAKESARRLAEALDEAWFGWNRRRSEAGRGASLAGRTDGSKMDLPR